MNTQIDLIRVSLNKKNWTAERCGGARALSSLHRLYAMIETTLVSTALVAFSHHGPIDLHDTRRKDTSLTFASTRSLTLVNTKKKTALKGIIIILTSSCDDQRAMQLQTQ